MTCNHEWVITAMSDISDDLLATHGWLYLKCVFCDGQARVVRPTADEVAQVAEIWHTGSYPIYEDTGDGRLIVLDNQRADDLLTAGDDDNIDAVGTTGWLETADDWQAHEFDHLDGHAPASCTHYWHVKGIIAAETENVEIELFCTRCHEYATVQHVADDEAETIAKAWQMGMALEWQDARRLTLYRDLQRPPVADLVDRLDLFEVDEGDDDVPF